jgi:iron complex transport system ATP-binding protein
MAEPIIECTDAVIEQGGRALMGPLSLTIWRGDFLGIVGPNGAGKSTLLQMLSGIRKPTGGTISFHGTRPDRFGVLFQHHQYSPDLPFTVEDVVYFGRLPHQRPGRRYQQVDHDTVDTILHEFDLADRRNQLFRELSGGEMRKVHLARIMVQSAEVVLLDEPTAGLDMDWKERLTGLTEKLYHVQHVPIVMVTHDIDRIPACCNVVLLLKDGREIAFGPPRDVLTPLTLSELYGCSLDIVHRDERYYAFHRGATPS